MFPATEQLLESLRKGDRVALSKAITLVESSSSADQTESRSLISHLSRTNQATRIAITGSPGVGKSTFIDALGWHLINQDRKIAVLAIDPSSGLSRGSILGDKTRMNRISRDPRAFIRPSPTGGVLGGIAAATYEASLLCEEAGYQIILIETVGVGQSESMVQHLADLFVLLLQPAAGDDLQGIKKGILEDAHLLVVNKWDTHLKMEAQHTRAAYQMAGITENRRIMLASAREDEGIAEIWETLNLLLNTIDLLQKRIDREVFWYLENTKRITLDYLLQKHAKLLAGLAEDIRAGQTQYSEAIEKAIKKICT